MKKLLKNSLRTLLMFALAAPLPALSLTVSAAVQGSSAAQVQGVWMSSVVQVDSTTFKVSFWDKRVMFIDFYGENIIRLYEDPSGAAMHDPVATPPAQILVDNPRRSPRSITMTRSGDVCVLQTPRIKVTVLLVDGLININDRVQMVQPVSFEKDKATIVLNCKDDEYFYGGGVQNGRFSHRGKSIAIENTNIWSDGGVASPTPFYWSTRGYGFMWHTFKAGRYDFGESEKGKVILSHNSNYLDVFFSINDTPVELLGDFYQLTGNPVLLPKFGFYEGHLNAYNRDYWTPAENGFMAYEDGKTYNESQKDNGGIKESLNGEKNNYQFSARAAIDRYLNNDMPLGWFLPNDGYGAGYGQTSTLDGNIENLRQFGEYARSKGVEIGLWTQSDLHPKDGVEALLQRDIVKEVGTAGVRVLKTDVAWVGAGYSFGLNGVADVADIMPRYGNNARPFIISLDGWAGTQRYAGIWTGDQTGGDWEYIRFHIPTFIGSGLSGQPNITNDLDGIFGGKNIPVNVRDFQWKTFTPMELNMDGWGSNPKYPQALGEPATSINRTYLKLKSVLMPYTYSIARQAVNGKPMIRAMFLDYPNKYTLGTQTQYQFLYGPSLLVAPIYRETKADKEGNDIRNGIYLPEGNWVDAFTGEMYEGNRIINDFDAPLWKLPVLVKEDAIIPMTNANNNPSEIDPNWRSYVIYAKKGTQFDEYDDDGTTQEYLNGKCTTTSITTGVDKKGTLTVTIDATQGGFEGFEECKATSLAINTSAEPKSVVVRVNGKKVKLPRLDAQTFDNAKQGWMYVESTPITMFMSKGVKSPVAENVKGNPRILVKIDEIETAQKNVVVQVKGFKPLKPYTLPTENVAESLAAPVVKFEQVNAYDVTPTWKAVEGAKYYEVMFDGMCYSTIRGTSLPFEDLTPETSYTFKVRAVGESGISPWATANVTTVADPLKWAVNGLTGISSFANQGGQGLNKLFDRDEKTVWHSQWSKADAVPGDVTIDLHSVNQLEKLVYLPREDAGNGTITAGTYSTSVDKLNWSEPVAFAWERSGKEKVINLPEKTTARYIRLHLTEGVGKYASGREFYAFKVPGSESILQGDINRDKRIDENDLTSYMNYTGLRRGDGDFDYVSIGDINNNGLIDGFDISVVTTQLDGGVRESNDHVSGSLEMTADKQTFRAGDEIRVTVSGKALHYVNGLSFALPYDATALGYEGVELKNMKNMTNLTYDRLHTNGQKALYPTFVNRGNDFLLDEGDSELFVIKFRAKKAGKFNLKMQDGLLIDRNLGTVAF